jgi:hypothetical protein
MAQNRQSSRMPRGNLKKLTIIRRDPALIAEFRAVLGTEANFGAAVAKGVRRWTDGYKRRQRAQSDPLAKYLAPPTARELRVHQGGE